MSASLVYEPVLEERKYRTLPDKLKFIFRDKFKLEDGGYTLNSTHLPYLQGLLDAGIPETKRLIDCLEKHGKVLIWLNY